MAAINIITKEDLEEFKNELLRDLSVLLRIDNNKKRKWIKSADVLKIMNISPGTLQNLRINGLLKFTKIGGIMYYKEFDVEQLFEKG
ncbi:helix-turn-helix domain-containing protein [Mucilaginibacter sp.]|uniref:helix-turn-helix domain-containing protein n=1 Tax=Mucilaginibacter sp. TaxID=1882438 RepID=UPI00326336BE